ncbi:Capsular polysaccharide synthesis protein [uncultured Blautia sp.]
MMRFLKIMMRFFKAIPMWFELKNEFNAKVALWMCYVYILPSQKNNRYMAVLREYFKQDLSELVCKYKEKKNSFSDYRRDEKIPLWTCWLTGYESMPEVVKICFHRMTKSVPKDKVKVILVTLDNYSQYIEIPHYILEKYTKGVISPAHFSDVIRFCLLSKYGGIWLDSTVYVSEMIPINYIEADYYTQKVSDISLYLNEPSRAQWCGFIWAGKKNNLLFSFVRDGLFYYWKKYNTVIDYIFFDYIIITAYNGIPWIKNMIDSLQPNNENIWDLWNVINEKYDEEVYQKICKNNIFHKLSYKGDLQIQTVDGFQSMYGHLLMEDESR